MQPRAHTCSNNLKRPRAPSAALGARSEAEIHLADFLPRGTADWN